MHSLGAILKFGFICVLHLPNHLVLNNDIETYGKYWPVIGQML